ncbi:MAG: hypothetical protein KJN99_13005 [Marinicaulis sp.]|nr:hypothetical protein [Marinicaulis sp.]
MIATLIFIASLFAALALLVTAALSPIETLSWWAGWTEREIEDDEPTDADNEATADAGATHYVVYLSGIASISGAYLQPREKAFIAALRRACPDVKVLDNVFPYSPAGLPLLASPRLFDRLWRWVQKVKLQGRATILEALINMRNVFQVLISADHRYGPIFNQGAADVIERALRDAGFRAGAPVTIIGYSGGAQVAIGAASFLKSRLETPLEVISVGGVMASDPGLHFVDRLHHFYGSGDNFERLGAIFFPERWSAMGHSEWNAGKRDGRIVLHKRAGIKHAGPRGYFGRIKFDKLSNSEKLLPDIVDIISGDCAPS